MILLLRFRMRITRRHPRAGGAAARRPPRLGGVSKTSWEGFAGLAKGLGWLKYV